MLILIRKYTFRISYNLITNNENKIEKYMQIFYVCYNIYYLNIYLYYIHERLYSFSSNN